MEAKIARELSIKGQGGMETIYNCIRDDADAGCTKSTLSQEMITNTQADLLRELGYTVSYNSACLWWEVSW